jgi:superoxide reductase
MKYSGDIFICSSCRTLVAVINDNGISLICCNNPMKLLEVKHESTDCKEHISTVEETNKSVKVRIGSKEHPMIKSHYIRRIKILTEKTVFCCSLEHGWKPEAVSSVNREDLVEVRALCSNHGLWGTFIIL